MNHQELFKSVQKRYESSKLHPVLKQFSKDVSIFPSSVMVFDESNAKRERVISNAASKIYLENHCVFGAIFGSYSSTVVLSINPFCFYDLFYDVANFMHEYKKFTDATQSSVVKNVQELNSYYKNSIPKLKEKDISALLVDDIKVVCEKNEDDLAAFNFKEMLSLFNDMLSAFNFKNSDKQKFDTLTQGVKDKIYDTFNLRQREY